MKHALLVILAIALASGSCGWEPARKKQLYDVEPEFHFAKGLEGKIKILSKYIEFSESMGCSNLL